MTTLDMRAAQATGSLQQAVAAHHTTLTVEQLDRRRLWNQVASTAMALAAIALLVGIALTIQVALPIGRVATQPPSTTVPATTVPPPDTPDVVVPPGGGGDHPIGTTTTSATPATTVTTTTPTSTTTPPTTTTVPVDREPPRLVILSPEDGAHVAERSIRFSGETEPGATVTAGRYEADMTDGGRWSIVLILEVGANRATFTATDAAGNTTTAGIVVYLDEPKDEPPADPPTEFTAHAQYGSCSELPPFDVYYGTGEPGSVVHIRSEFGSGRTVVGEEGHWELRVEFPEAPYGVTFLVTVRDDADHRKRFEFVSYAER